MAMDFLKEKMEGGGVLHAQSVFVANIPSKTSKRSIQSSNLIRSRKSIKSISYDIVLFSSAVIVTSQTSNL